MRFAVIVGHPKPQSRTLAVAAAAAQAISDTAGPPGGFGLIDLSALAPRLLQPGPCAAATFKGTYSGLLKVFLDLLPHRALEGAVALPLLVMKLPQHAPAVDAHLRPLLVELGACVPTAGLAVLESDLGALGSVLWPWAGRVAAALGEAASPALAG